MYTFPGLWPFIERAAEGRALYQLGRGRELWHAKQVQDALGQLPRLDLESRKALLAHVVQVRDSLGNSAVKDLKISVVAPGSLSVKTLALPDSLVNVDYLTDLAAEVAGGGALQKPLVWSVVSGQLPEGLVLETHTDHATGILSGAYSW